MGLLLQLTVSGIVTGALYSMLGLGFGLIYGVTRVFHFAYVISFALAAYTSYWFVRELGWPLLPAAIPAAIAAVALGYVAERLVYAPMRDREGSGKVILVASFAIFVIGQNTLQLVFGATALTYYPEGFLKPTIWGSVVFNIRDILTVVLAIGVFLALHFALRMKWGRALRAVVDSSRMSAVVGIDVRRAYLMSFIVGSLLVVPPAMLVVSAEGATPWMGLNVMFPAVAATVVGGVGSLRGAALAGFLIGLLQNVLVWQLGNQWQNAIIFFVLILFFLYRPEGLFGRPVAKVRV